MIHKATFRCSFEAKIFVELGVLVEISLEIQKFKMKQLCHWPLDKQDNKVPEFVVRLQGKGKYVY